MDVRTHQLRLVLIDPALKVLPRINRSKYIKSSDHANMNGYDKWCHNTRKEYHKAKSKHNKRKSTDTYSTMKEKNKKYEKEITRVKNKENTSVVKKQSEREDNSPILNSRIALH